MPLSRIFASEILQKSSVRRIAIRWGMGYKAVLTRNLPTLITEWRIAIAAGKTVIKYNF